MIPQLSVKNLSVTYGGVKALKRVSMELPRGTVTGLIGPNGAGKTTLVDAITGFTRYTGRVEVAGRSMERMEAHQRARAGLVRTFQSLELFDDLTVLENLTVAAMGGALPGTALETLDRFGIADLAERAPTALSNGQRKLVAVARSLMSDPKVLVLDEPAAGLDSNESLDLGRQLRLLAESGLTILLIDHDMGLIMGHCDAVTVLQFGEVIAQGTSAEVRNDAAVLSAYLGGSTPAAVTNSGPEGDERT